MRTKTLPTPLVPIVKHVLGEHSAPMDDIAQRAQQLLPGRSAIVWEGDATTFQFSYVSAAAEELLGYPRRRWTDEPAFWGETVVHPEDRDDAIAYCALATGNCQDHDFVYRALTADGRVVWLHDIVKVIPGAKGIPERLRGLMLDVTDEIAGDHVTSATS